MTKSVTSSAREARQRRIQKNANVVGYWIIGVAAAVVLMVVMAVVLANRPATITSAPPDVPAEWIDGKNLGSPEAKVAIQMWEDFMCPACRQFNAAVKPQLMQDYVIPGTVRLEFRHFPLQTHAPGALQAAAASECAVEQGAFWIYHDRLFSAQDQGQAGFTPEALIGYADELDLDLNAFRECVTSQKHVAAANESANQAIAMNLGGTPSLLINGTFFEAWNDYNAMKGEIDRLLAAN